MWKCFTARECKFNSVVCIVDRSNVTTFGRIIENPTRFDMVTFNLLCEQHKIRSWVTIVVNDGYCKGLFGHSLPHKSIVQPLFT